MSSIIANWPEGDDPLKLNVKQLLCDIANASGNDNWDGLIRNKGVDIDQYKLDPAVFNNVGDQRFSLGQTLSAVYQEFLPRIAAITEIGIAGGCQIINQYICDSDGTPIVKASSNCDNVTNLERIQPEEVINFIKKTVDNGWKDHANKFIVFINKEIKAGWIASLIDIPSIPGFYIKLTKTGSTSRFYPYYPDQLDYVSKQLKLTPIVKDDVTQPVEANPADLNILFKTLSKPFLDF
jgi:hypothetical protein